MDWCGLYRHGSYWLDRAYGLDRAYWLDWCRFNGNWPHWLDRSYRLDGCRFHGNRPDGLDRSHWPYWPCWFWRWIDYGCQRHHVYDGLLPAVFASNVRHRVEHLHVECEASL